MEFILVATTVWFIGAVAVSVYVHRGLSHGLIKFSPILEYILLIFSIASGIGTPVGWAAVHRMHHEYLDTDLDPHSPWRIGFWRSYFHLWDWNAKDVPYRMARGLISNKRAMFFHSWALPILILIWVVALSTSVWFASAMALGAAFGVHGMGITNAVSHYAGEPKKIRDLPASLSWVNIGEGQHEYHHRVPYDYSFGKGFSDIGARFVELLEKFGLATIKRIK